MKMKKEFWEQWLEETKSCDPDSLKILQVIKDLRSRVCELENELEKFESEIKYDHAKSLCEVSIFFTEQEMKSGIENLMELAGRRIMEKLLKIHRGYR